MRVKIRKLDDGYDCHFTIGGVTIGAESGDPVSALNAASGLATDFTKIMEAHPELKLLLPPGASSALQAIRIAAWAAKNGKLPEVAAQLGPTAVKTVKKILSTIF